VRRAFTLIEVLLAISLVAALLAALFAFYRYATDLRRDIVEDAQLLSAARNTMDGLTNELRTAMAYPTLNIGLEGSNDRIGFLSTVLPGQGVWNEPDPTVEAAPPEQDLQVLTYQLRVDSNTKEVLGLERLSQRNISSLSQGGGQQVKLISPRLRFLNFRFYDGTGWRDYWRMEDPFGEQTTQSTPLLPVAVEITIGLDPIPEEMTLEDYLAENPTRTFQRIIFVPAGAQSISAASGAASTGGTP
jgi:prepilin-type N-terminal cleavage/methylation domain-containing protein